MGSSSAAQAFAFAPNFQKGIKAAGRVIVILNRQSKITDPIQPAAVDFVRTMIFILILMTPHVAILLKRFFYDNDSLCLFNLSPIRKSRDRTTDTSDFSCFTCLMVMFCPFRREQAKRAYKTWNLTTRRDKLYKSLRTAILR